MVLKRPIEMNQYRKKAPGSRAAFHHPLSETKLCGRFTIVMGVPQNGWMLFFYEKPQSKIRMMTPIAGWFFMENPTKIRMMTGGTPYDSGTPRNPPRKVSDQPQLRCGSQSHEMRLPKGPISRQ